jgi:hypothetical protein
MNIEYPMSNIQCRSKLYYELTWTLDIHRWIFDIYNEPPSTSKYLIRISNNECRIANVEVSFTMNLPGHWIFIIGYSIFIMSHLLPARIQFEYRIMNIEYPMMNSQCRSKLYYELTWTLDIHHWIFDIYNEPPSTSKDSIRISNNECRIANVEVMLYYELTWTLDIHHWIFDIYNEPPSTNTDSINTSSTCVLPCRQASIFANARLPNL